ncbi:MAG: hypothetical protein NTX17_02675 [Candidatus Eisenbacteria bacterium]|nr:hypothetical protein [Candidatus Eisenbacteria bacterium]
MSETRGNSSGFSLLHPFLSFLLVSVLVLCSSASGAIAQLGIAPVYPEFIWSSVVCGDREIKFSWSTVVEERLAQIADSLTGLGLTVPDSLKFGSYRVWRSEVPDTSQMMLLREFTAADTVSWTFIGDERQFADPDSVFEIRLVKTKVGYDSLYVRMRVSLDLPGPYNGVGYYYAITYHDSVGTQRSGKADCFTYLPTHAVAEQNRSAEKVWVVPNPYHGSSSWDASEGKRIQFINLPASCKVSIYTIAGDLVRVLHHPDPDYFNYGSYGGALNWNLQNENGREVVPGVYIFYVEGEGGEVYKGHFVIIR